MRVLCVVPGPGLEPGWVAPTVFETVASTDSAIRAMVRCGPDVRCRFGFAWAKLVSFFRSRK